MSSDIASDATVVTLRRIADRERTKVMFLRGIADFARSLRQPLSGEDPEGSGDAKVSGTRRPHSRHTHD